MSDNRPISEQFRVAAKDWVEKDSAARLLEESKSAVLAQRMAAEGDIPAAHSERNVKASEEWRKYLRKMNDARTAANLAKVKMEWLRMRFNEWQSAEANKRAEMKL